MTMRSTSIDETCRIYNAETGTHNTPDDFIVKAVHQYALARTSLDWYEWALQGVSINCYETYYDYIADCADPVLGLVRQDFDNWLESGRNVFAVYDDEGFVDRYETMTERIHSLNRQYSETLKSRV